MERRLAVGRTFPLRVSRKLRVWLVAVLAVSLALVPTGPIRAQSESIDNQAVLLAEPGMAFVNTTTRICVRFKQYFEGTSALRFCETSQTSGSGFFVRPDGVLVTATHVVTVEGRERQALKNRIVNRLFIGAGLLIPNPGRSLDDRHVIPDVDMNNHLQGCYSSDECEFNIGSKVQVLPAVTIAGVSTPKPLTADVLNASSFLKSDVAILKVESTNTPTIPLAPSIADVETGQSVAVLGYAGWSRELPTGMTQPTRKYGFVSAVRTGLVGTGTQIQLDIDLVRGLSGGATLDARGKGIGLASYSILDAGTPEDGVIRSVNDIRAALKTAGVEAARGEVDSTFEQAMGYYWDHHYSAALPLFQKVLNLYDGHPLAKAYQAKAQAAAGGPEDVPLAPASQGPQGLRRYQAWLPLAIALLVLVILSVVVLRGRRRTAAGTPEGVHRLHVRLGRPERVLAGRAGRRVRRGHGHQDPDQPDPPVGGHRPGLGAGARRYPHRGGRRRPVLHGLRHAGTSGHQLLRQVRATPVADEPPPARHGTDVSVRTGGALSM
jgi:S1-C subfamily serine protease